MFTTIVLEYQHFIRQCVEYISPATRVT